LQRCKAFLFSRAGLFPASFLRRGQTAPPPCLFLKESVFQLFRHPKIEWEMVNRNPMLISEKSLDASPKGQFSCLVRRITSSKHGIPFEVHRVSAMICITNKRFDVFDRNLRR